MSGLRNIPAALQAHLDSGATTITYFMRIMPIQPGFPDVGVTMGDQTQDYDDGDGVLTYQAAIGMVPAMISYSSEMDVDNSQAQHAVPAPEYDLPISEADIVSGAYDFARFRVYLVNYEDLSMGHVVITDGQLGRMTVQDGLSFSSEWTAKSKQLKQSIVEKDSLTCRATFGSQAPGTGSGAPEQKFPCGKDATALFTSAKTVTGVGLENTRTFTASGLGLAADACVPGMLVWLTGANAGRTYEVEAQSAAGVVSQAFEAMFPIQVGDTFKIRPDCTKWKDGHNGCKTHFPGNTWKLHYRGEPLIPVQDSDQINTPGATVGAGLGGSTTSSA